MPRRRTLSFIAKFGISLAALVWLIHRTDTTRLMMALSSITLPFVLLALLALAVQTLLTAYRWLLIARGLGLRVPPFRIVLQVVMVSLLLNQCFPSFIGGDAYRIYWLKRDGSRLGLAFRSVMIDRISAFVALVIMLAAGLPWLTTRFSEPFERIAWLLLAAGLTGTIVFLTSDRLFGGLRHNRFTAQISTLSSDARRLLLRDRKAGFVVPLAFGVQLLTAVTLFIYARGMALPLGLVDCVLITPPVMLLAAVPVSIAGWGLREGVIVGLLSLLGIESYSALALSLMLGVSMLVTAMLGFFPLLVDWNRYSPLRFS